MNGLIKTAAAAALIGALTSPVAAQNVTADHDQVREVLQEAGYRAQMTESADQRYIQSATNGLRFSVFFFGCDDEEKNCKSVQFYAGFAREKVPTLEAMNTYASENRFGRIYLDSDNDPVIEMDIDLEQGGMSKELFLDNLAYWEAILVGFAEFVDEHD